MCGFNERTLARPACAPQQYVVCREPGGEPLGVVQQNVPNPVDPAQQPDLDPVDLVYRLQRAAVGGPHEGITGIEGDGWGCRRAAGLPSLGDPGQHTPATRARVPS